MATVPEVLSGRQPQFPQFHSRGTNKKPFIVNIEPRAMAGLSPWASKLLFALLQRADGHTGQLKLDKSWRRAEPYWFSGKDFQRWLGCSKPTRIDAVNELIGKGLMTRVQPRQKCRIKGRLRSVADHVQHTLHRIPITPPKPPGKPKRPKTVKKPTILQESNSLAVEGFVQEVFQEAPLAASVAVAVAVEGLDFSPSVRFSSSAPANPQPKGDDENRVRGKNPQPETNTQAQPKPTQQEDLRLKVFQQIRRDPAFDPMTDQRIERELLKIHKNAPTPPACAAYYFKSFMNNVGEEFLEYRRSLLRPEREKEVNDSNERMDCATCERSFFQEFFTRDGELMYWLSCPVCRHVEKLRAQLAARQETIRQIEKATRDNPESVADVIERDRADCRKLEKEIRMWNGYGIGVDNYLSTLRHDLAEVEKDISNYEEKLRRSATGNNDGIGLGLEVHLKRRRRTRRSIENKIKRLTEIMGAARPVELVH